MYKIFFALMLTPLFFVWELNAQGRQEEAMSPKIRELFNKTQDDPENMDLIVREQQRYIDLKQEIDRMKMGYQEKYDEEVLNHEMSDRMSELKELEGKLEELKGKRMELESEIQNASENNPNLKLLVTLYESISADQAAALLKRMPISVSLAMMKMMSPRKSSKILAAMDPKMAAEVSRQLLKSRVKMEAKL